MELTVMRWSPGKRKYIQIRRHTAHEIEVNSRLMNTLKTSGRFSYKLPLNNVIDSIVIDGDVRLYLSKELKGVQP